jgi:toxin-antitoxin system PIN domain toxin
MTNLLDVNVLVAMAWPTHQEHAKVLSWLKEHAREGWATCPLTQIAFVRLLSNPQFSPDALTPQESLALLEANLAHPAHLFWGDLIGLAEALRSFEGKLQGHRQVTDAYLLGLAIHHKGRLVTLDRGIVSLPPAKSPLRQRIVLIQ